MIRNHFNRWVGYAPYPPRHFITLTLRIALKADDAIDIGIADREIPVRMDLHGQRNPEHVGIINRSRPRLTHRHDLKADT
jgi:hypothetical protein